MKTFQRINLNTADARLISQSLHRIGQGLAEDIVQLRDTVADSQGREMELEDLAQIPTNRISLNAWKENFVRNYICFDDTLAPPSRQGVCNVFPGMFSADEMAAYEEAVQGNMGAIRSHVDTELDKLRTEQDARIEEQNSKIEALKTDMSQQVTDAKETLKSNIDSVNTDLLNEIKKVDNTTQSLMNSIREMRDELTRSSDRMKETVDAVLSKVEAHDKTLREKYSSSAAQPLNTQVPSAPIVPPAINVAVPVHPNPLYNPNPYFNPVVPSVPFVRPPPVFVGPPPYHPQLYIQAPSTLAPVHSLRVEQLVIPHVSPQVEMCLNYRVHCMTVIRPH